MCRRYHNYNLFKSMLSVVPLECCLVTIFDETQLNIKRNGLYINIESVV